MIERGHGWELRLGDYREVLADVVADHCITDPPYLGAKTAGGGEWAPGARHQARDEPVMGHYGAASEESLADACAFAVKHCKTWVVMFNDFPGTVVIQRELRMCARVVAEPIAWVKPPACTPPRGSLWIPEKGTEFITAARVRHEAANGRVLPGSYIGPQSSTPVDLVVTGGKPLLLMRSIIRDYTEPGDLVLDMHGGGGTTLLAAVIEGRRAIGAEIHEETFHKAVKRLRAGHSMSLDFG